MDAATLFMVLVLPSGATDTATREFADMTVCESEAKRYLALGSPSPGVTSRAHCVRHYRITR